MLLSFVLCSKLLFERVSEYLARGVSHSNSCGYDIIVIALLIVERRCLICESRCLKANFNVLKLMLSDLKDMLSLSLLSLSLSLSLLSIVCNTMIDNHFFVNFKFNATQIIKSMFCDASIRNEIHLFYFCNFSFFQDVYFSS